MRAHNRILAARVGDDLHEAVTRLAAANETTPSQVVRVALEQATGLSPRDPAWAEAWLNGEVDGAPDAQEEV